MCQCLRPMQPLNIRIPGPDRNAHLAFLLGNLLSLKKGQQNFSANLEGSHTDQSFFRNKCGIFPGSQKTKEEGTDSRSKYKRKGASKRN